MTWEAEEKEKRLRSDLDQLGSQQEQTQGTLDTRIDAMLERCTQPIMDTLNGHLETGDDPETEEHTRGKLAENRE